METLWQDLRFARRSLTAHAILMFVAIAASWIPAWRASRLDPVRALRG